PDRAKWFSASGLSPPGCPCAARSLHWTACGPVPSRVRATPAGTFAVADDVESVAQVGQRRTSRGWGPHVPAVEYVAVSSRAGGATLGTRAGDHRGRFGGE